jgi:phage gp36-like protein
MYATEDDFALFLGAAEADALADPQGIGQPVPGRLANALQAASDDIDTLLGARAAAASASFLRTACVHIARWHLSGGGAIETDPITRRHKFYTDTLRDMADGQIGGSQNDGTQSVDEAVIVQAAAPRRFGGRRC